MKRLLLPLAALLAGCAGEPIRSTLPTPEPTIDLHTIENWSVAGRVAIQHGSEGWSARMQWHKSGAHYQIRLIAPLGRGTYQLAGDRAKVELIVPDGSRYYAANAQALMDAHLGWSIPIEGAEYWLRGLVAPGSTPSYINRDAAGRLLDMEQQGWRVSISRRMQVSNLELPAKLFMHIEDLKVRIAISSWKLANE